ncbi:prohead protease/major capsid protein fusion protein [uncultured Paraglaciecola sp.]|uniref:prohead protease/major capsid protein fusion protein n=1 Tax=uncultured Paraglaciecola sp. TaxID=1765024 RepID=UPI0026213E03|nr:prohead protease/major capsid protein fusion protein [uncultured Paraglaciecola sp.]
MPEQILTRNIDLSTATRSEDSESNLVLEFPFSSETPYQRDTFFSEPWIEVLGHKSSEVDLSRLEDGAPVLLNHGYSKTSETGLRAIGATTGAFIRDGKGYVSIKLSRRDDMKPILQDINDGLIRNVSVGYKIIDTKITKRSVDAPDEIRVTNWLPMEVTLCDVPADATVGIGRSINEDEEMPKQNIKEDEPNVVDAVREESQPVIQEKPVIDEQKIQDSAIKAERKRSAEINKAVRGAGLDDSVAERMISEGVSIEHAREQVINLLAERTEKTDTTSRADIHTIVDETETRREMMGAALLHRYDPSKELPEGARQYRGLSLLEMTRENMRVRGVDDKGMDRLQVATRAFESTSDLPDVLADVANKTLRQAYEAAPRTFQPWARQSSASDFKSINRMTLSDAPALETVNENGEFKRGAVTDGKESYQLATVGKIIGLTRQAIINDDLNSFTRIPSMFATAAANYESDTVYGILTGNAALSDGDALFHANHVNLTSTGTVISVNSLSKGREMLRKQKTPKKVVMNLRPRFLLVPAALETIATQFVSSNYVANQSNTINPFAGALEVISEARLDDDSATAWYLLADNNQIDTVEYAYLEGNNGVFIETRQGFDVDGMEIKARLDFAAKAIDYRGVYKNNGA